jgi:hypothetical protein
MPEFVGTWDGRPLATLLNGLDRKTEAGLRRVAVFRHGYPIGLLVTGGGELGTFRAPTGCKAPRRVCTNARKLLEAELHKPTLLALTNAGLSLDQISCLGYNWLSGKLSTGRGRASGTEIERRHQALVAYPLLTFLLPAEPVADFPLERAIDDGRPLADILAERTKLPRWAVRRLQGLRADWVYDPDDPHFFADWDVRCVLGLLNYVAPNHFPASKAAWQGLRAIGELLRSATAWMTDDTARRLTWTASFTALRGQFEEFGLTRGSAARPIDLIDDVIRTLIGPFLVHGAPDGVRPLEAEKFLAVSARLLFCRRTAVQICEMSEWWHARARDIRRDLATRFPRTDMDKRAEEFSWPGLTAPFRTSRGWTIHPLTDAAMLGAEHDALGHCVDTYARYCVVETTHLLSIRDPEGLNVSTVEIEELRLQAYCENCAKYGFERAVVQHRAAFNVRPPAEASRALEEWAAALLAEDRPPVDFELLRTARQARRAELAWACQPGEPSFRMLYGCYIPDYDPANPEARQAAWNAYAPLLPDAVRRARPDAFVDICRAVIAPGWSADLPWSDLIATMERSPAVAPAAAPLAPPPPPPCREQPLGPPPRRAADRARNANARPAIEPDGMTNTAAGIRYDGDPKNIGRVDTALMTMPLVRQTLGDLGVIVLALPSRGYVAGPARAYFDDLSQTLRNNDRLRPFGLRRLPIEALPSAPLGVARLEVWPELCADRNHGRRAGTGLRVHLALTTADLVYPLVPHALVDEAIAVLANDGERLLATVRMRAARERLLDVIRWRAAPQHRITKIMTALETSLIRAHRDADAAVAQLSWPATMDDLSPLCPPDAPSVLRWPEYWGTGLNMALVANGLETLPEVGSPDWLAHMRRRAFTEVMAAHILCGGTTSPDAPRWTLPERSLRAAVQEATRLARENGVAFTSFVAVAEAAAINRRSAPPDSHPYCARASAAHVAIAEEFVRRLAGYHPAESIRQVAAHIVRVGAMGKTLMPADRNEAGEMLRALASNSGLGAILADASAWADHLPSPPPDRLSAYGTRVVHDASFICSQFSAALRLSQAVGETDRAAAVGAVETEIARLPRLQGPSSRRSPDIYWSALSAGALAVLCHPGAWPDIVAGKIELLHRLGSARDSDAFALAAHGMISGLQRLNERVSDFPAASLPG